MRKNLIFVIESPFPFYSGGIENWLYNVLLRLPTGYNVTVISEASKDNNEPPFYKLPKHTRFKYYSTLRINKAVRFLFQNTFLRKYEIMWHTVCVSRILGHLELRQQETTIIALGTLMATSGALLYKKKHPDVRVVCSARGLHAETEAIQIPSLKNFFVKKEKCNVINSDILAVNGEDTYSYYFDKYGAQGQILLNGVDVESYKKEYPSPFKWEGPCIVSVGTLIDIKGVRELIKAFALLSERSSHKKTKLFFVGKGKTERYYKMAELLGVHEQVCFWGPSKFVVPFYKNASVVTCLSGGGGFSMAALEAMASKTPIVAWDSPVYRQFNTKEKTMELVEEGNIEQLSLAIQKILDCPDQFTSMGDRAFKQACLFDWPNVISNLLKICEGDEYTD